VPGEVSCTLILLGARAGAAVRMLRGFVLEAIYNLPMKIPLLSGGEGLDQGALAGTSLVLGGGAQPLHEGGDELIVLLVDVLLSHSLFLFLHLFRYD